VDSSIEKENIEINSNQEISYAGFWLRCAAYLIDYLVIMLLALLLGILIGIFVGILELLEAIPENFEDTTALALIITIVFLMFASMYFAFSESSIRQSTYGKWVLNLRVVDLAGGRISFSKALIRNFLKILLSGTLTLSVGYLMIAFTKKKQGLHDLIGKSLVIKVPRISEQKFIHIQINFKSKLPIVTKIIAYIVPIMFIIAICMLIISRNITETNNLVVNIWGVSVLTLIFLGVIGAILTIISYITKIEARRVAAIKFAINVISMVTIILVIVYL